MSTLDMDVMSQRRLSGPIREPNYIVGDALEAVLLVGFSQLRGGERSCDSQARSVPAASQRRNAGGPVEFLTAVTARLSEMYQPSNVLSRVCLN